MRVVYLVVSLCIVALGLVHIAATARLFSPPDRSGRLVRKRWPGNHVNWRAKYSATSIWRDRSGASVGLYSCEYRYDGVCFTCGLRLASLGWSIRSGTGPFGWRNSSLRDATTCANMS